MRIAMGLLVLVFSGLVSCAAVLADDDAPAVGRAGGGAARDRLQVDREGRRVNVDPETASAN